MTVILPHEILNHRNAISIYYSWMITVLRLDPPINSTVLMLSNCTWLWNQCWVQKNLTLISILRRLGSNSTMNIKEYIEIIPWLPHPNNNWENLRENRLRKLSINSIINQIKTKQVKTFSHWTKPSKPCKKINSRTGLRSRKSGLKNEKIAGNYCLQTHFRSHLPKLASFQLNFHENLICHHTWVVASNWLYKMLKTT